MNCEWKPSDVLRGLMDVALGHATESIKEGDTLVPFVLFEREGEVSIERCIVTMRNALGEECWDPGPSAEKAREKARARGSAKAVARAVAAYDGYLRNRDGSRLDAIVLEAYEDGAPVAAMLAQAYEPPNNSLPFCLVGDPVMLGVIERMW